MTGFLPANHFVYLSDNRSDFKETLISGLNYFVKQGLINQNETERVLRRELEGNQLILNHISIPHISAKITNSYEVFAITFPNRVKIGSNSISFILIVLANVERNDNGIIFGYLYSRLRDKKAERLNHISSYEELIKFLK